jgi:hypothetical protein
MLLTRGMTVRFQHRRMCATAADAAFISIKLPLAKSAQPDDVGE